MYVKKKDISSLCYVLYLLERQMHQLFSVYWLKTFCKELMRHSKKKKNQFS